MFELFLVAATLLLRASFATADQPLVCFPLPPDKNASDFNFTQTPTPSLGPGSPGGGEPGVDSFPDLVPLSAEHWSRWLRASMTETLEPKGLRWFVAPVSAGCGIPCGDELGLGMNCRSHNKACAKMLDIVVKRKWLCIGIIVATMRCWLQMDMADGSHVYCACAKRRQLECGI